MFQVKANISLSLLKKCEIVGSFSFDQLGMLYITEVEEGQSVLSLEDDELVLVFDDDLLEVELEEFDEEFELEELELDELELDLLVSLALSLLSDSLVLDLSEEFFASLEVF